MYCNRHNIKNTPDLIPLLLCFFFIVLLPQHPPSKQLFWVNCVENETKDDITWRKGKALALLFALSGRTAKFWGRRSTIKVTLSHLKDCRKKETEGKEAGPGTVFSSFLSWTPTGFRNIQTCMEEPGILGCWHTSLRTSEGDYKAKTSSLPLSALNSIGLLIYESLTQEWRGAE